MEDVFDDTEEQREEDGDKENGGEDGEKVEQLQAEIESLQIQLGDVDKNVEKLLNSIETLRPLYNQVWQVNHLLYFDFQPI